MIDKLDISGKNFKVSERLEGYIREKIGRLDRLLPSHAKKSVQVRVILSESNNKYDNATCEVVMELPHNTITAKESAANMFSSIDIVEDKLSRQIRKYKTAHGQQKKDRRFLHRLLGRARRRK